MCENYKDICPDCKTELFFANRNNYVDRCLGCGKYFKIMLVSKEITEKEYKEIKRSKDVGRFPEAGPGEKI